MEKTCKNCNRTYRTEQDFLSMTSRWRVCDQGNLWFECQCQSTLMIPKAKFDWYNPSKFLSPEAGSIFNRLGGMKELPYIPAAIMQLQQLLNDPDVNIAKIVSAVKKDPFIATDIIQFAKSLNQSRQAGARKIDSLEHAIIYIGLKTVSNLILVASLRTFAVKVKSFSEQQFWLESFACAIIAEYIARQRKFATSDDAYLAGCLLNVGKIVSGICLPDELDNIYNFVKDPKSATSWTNAENELSATSHTRLGEIGAALWGFPNFVGEAITGHHTLKRCDLPLPRAKSVEFHYVISLANQLSHWALLQPERIDNALLTDTSTYLKVSQADLEKIVEAVTPTIKSLD